MQSKKCPGKRHQYIPSRSPYVFVDEGEDIPSAVESCVEECLGDGTCEVLGERESVKGRRLNDEEKLDQWQRARRTIIEELREAEKVKAREDYEFEHTFEEQEGMFLRVDEQQGLHPKYKVTKRDGPTDPDAEYFVLRVDTDPHARAALRKYADSIYLENHTLACDLYDWLDRVEPVRCPGCCDYVSKDHRDHFTRELTKSFCKGNEPCLLCEGSGNPLGDEGAPDETFTSSGERLCEICGNTNPVHVHKTREVKADCGCGPDGCNRDNCACSTKDPTPTYGDVPIMPSLLKEEDPETTCKVCGPSVKVMGPEDPPAIEFDI